MFVAEYVRRTQRYVCHNDDNNNNDIHNINDDNDNIHNINDDNYAATRG